MESRDLSTRLTVVEQASFAPPNIMGHHRDACWNRSLILVCLLKSDPP
jgi:hypothetical protein